MSRITAAVALLAVGLALCLAAFAAASRGVTATPDQLQATRLRSMAVAFAGGPDALANVHSFAYDFVFGTDPKAMMVHHHAYDADKQLYRYETTLATFAKTNFWKGDHWTTDPAVPVGKNLVAIYHFPRLEGTVYIDGKPLSGEENMALLRRVNDSVQNDRYFAFLPLIVANPAVHADLAPPVKDEKYGELQGFTAWSGKVKATNRTLWTLYLTPKGELVRTDIVVLNGKGPFVVYWEDWKQFGPVKLPQKHVIPAMKREFRHENIRINQPLRIQPPKPPR
ncbi:MAG: hypothetical protein ACE149_13395 [Armatimonadota bacterium]